MGRISSTLNLVSTKEGTLYLEIVFKPHILQFHFEGPYSSVYIPCPAPFVYVQSFTKPFIRLLLNANRGIKSNSNCANQRQV